MSKRIEIRAVIIVGIVAVLIISSAWGFFSHQRINRLAVFILPPDMIVFYKRNIKYIERASVNPDRRRFTVVDEAPRHYIDIDHYGDSAWQKMPRYWNDAVCLYTEDTLKAYGILPWHINRVYYQLRDAFMVRDPQRILRLSAELGHYIADANVPLHTTENYNGQLTGQIGIHAFWESRLPELFSDNYNFFVGKAEYIGNPQLAAWNAIVTAHMQVDSVLIIEKELSQQLRQSRFTFETKGRQTTRAYSREYARSYHIRLRGMVEKQMRASITMIGNFWYSAWIDAGQPELTSLSDQQPSQEELTQRKEALAEWKQQNIRVREHESIENQ